MLNAKQVQKLVRFWQETMEDNYKTMQSLYQNRRYSACLFFGHLVIEKALKILVIKKTKEYPPKVHVLPRLAELAGETFLERETELLENVSEFNLETRYPEDRREFAKRCTKKFVDQYYSNIQKLYRELCRRMKQKK